MWRSYFKVYKENLQHPHTPILIINRINVLFHGAKDGDSDILHAVRYINKPFKAYNAEYEKTMKEAYINTHVNFRKTMMFMLQDLYLNFQ